MADSKYAKAKIYRLTAGGLTYYGSTYQSLSNRLAGHRANYIQYMKGTFAYVSSFELFKGDNKPIITLVESYPCKSREELLARERYYVENYDCVNMRTPGLTRKEVCNKYYESNKEKIKDYQDSRKEEKKAYDKKYVEQNKEHKQEWAKGYYANNSEKIIQRTREWRQKYSEKKKADDRRTFKCACGAETTVCNRARHDKGAKHIKIISQLNADASCSLVSVSNATKEKAQLQS